MKYSEVKILLLLLKNFDFKRCRIYENRFYYQIDTGVHHTRIYVTLSELSEADPMEIINKLRERALEDHMEYLEKVKEEIK